MEKKYKKFEDIVAKRGSGFCFDKRTHGFVFRSAEVRKNRETILRGYSLENWEINVPLGSCLILNSCDLRHARITGGGSVNIMADCLLDSTTIILKVKLRLHSGDLNGADIDFCWVHLSCGSVGKTDKSNRFFRQLLYHAMSVNCPEAKELRKCAVARRLAKKFHRFEEAEHTRRITHGR